MTLPAPNPSRRLTSAAVLLLALAGVALIGAIVLAGLNHAIPDQLWTAFFAALAGGAGNAHPTPPDGA
jgi:hypothetical protein